MKTSVKSSPEQQPGSTKLYEYVIKSSVRDKRDFGWLKDCQHCQHHGTLSLLITSVFYHLIKSESSYSQHYIMRGVASALVLGAAFALAAEDQQVLRKGGKDSSDSSAPLHPLSSYISSLKGETKEIWDEVTELFPEAVERVELYSYPKPHTRRPDSHWTTIIKGADVQNLWVDQAEGKREREVDGKLAPYTLRSRSVDPSKLGVDPGVKQWSGYLDDDENDKHLFYCML